jgi:XTP/dITP diphosphohydrolase
MRVLLASNNAHKRVEIEALLGPLGVEVLVPADVGGVPDVDEDADTFAGNAAKKALAAARLKSLWALADDSGLVVDALDGAPGVRSARYAGEPGDDARNNAKLLEALAGLPHEERSAHFACALCLADPDGNVRLEVAGSVDGHILEQPRGTSGFGYDPLFLFDGRSFAELALDQKALVSHRGRALRELAARFPDHPPRRDIARLSP